MDDERKDRIAGWISKVIVAALVAFTIWLVFIIVFDPGPAPCLGLGGC